MASHGKIKIGLSALALAGLSVGGFATQGLTSAFAAAGTNAKKAESEAKIARKAIAKRKGELAVAHAELAVANDPMNADYRALLGQAYLLAGRFTSAAEALNDALALNPEDGKVALNLTLAKIAQGDWAGARTTLQTHADQIPASDRGLAFALAGDPVTAVEILSPAARDSSATAKTRQNLALSLALAGRWKEATEIAAMDVAPDQLQARVTQWAAFARPTNAYDQVASLLGVTAVQDAGQPAQLALAQQPGVAIAAVAPVQSAQAAQDKPLDAYMPGPATQIADVVVEVPNDPQPEPEQVAGTGAQVVFGAREEVSQSAPAPVAAPVREAAVRAATASRASRGAYFVQLGAYANANGARDGWARHQRRVATLSEATPQSARVKTRAGTFYRLSVGGYARSDAEALCRQVKASGGACFVRQQAGDMVAAWARPWRQQVASR
jgi:Flp pilus assembly protein TadD